MSTRSSNYNVSNRISTIVQAESESEAIQLANDKFIPVLDLMAMEYAIANINLSDVGIIRNLVTGKLQSFLIHGVFKSGIFRRNISDIQRWDPISDILFKVDNGKGELSSRYLRAVHWSHRARDESDKQLSVLFNYFSLEALFKQNKDDNITAIVRCFLGFPGGKHLLGVDKEIINSLQQDAHYLSLLKSKKIPDALDRIRIFRNDSVHAGFRAIDISNQDLVFYSELLCLATARCLNAVRFAILHDKCTNIEDFKKNAVYLFNEIVNKTDILGNVVFGLYNTKDITHNILLVE